MPIFKIVVRHIVYFDMKICNCDNVVLWFVKQFKNQSLLAIQKVK